jgi:hypothetical protein
MGHPGCGGTIRVSPIPTRVYDRGIDIGLLSQTLTKGIRQRWDDRI